jgi:hypothetical protein
MKFFLLFLTTYLSFVTCYPSNEPVEIFKFENATHKLTKYQRNITVVGSRTCRGKDDCSSPVFPSSENFISYVTSSKVYGKTLQIMKYVNEQAVIDSRALNDLLLHDKIKHRKIVVVAIVGESRTGKSFFMNYCLRFMYAHVSASCLTVSSVES